MFWKLFAGFPTLLLMSVTKTVCCYKRLRSENLSSFYLIVFPSQIKARLHAISSRVAIWRLKRPNQPNLVFLKLFARNKMFAPFLGLFECWSYYQIIGLFTFEDLAFSKELMAKFGLFLDLATLIWRSFLENYLKFSFLQSLKELLLHFSCTKLRRDYHVSFYLKFIESLNKNDTKLDCFNSMKICMIYNKHESLFSRNNIVNQIKDTMKK